MSGGQTEENKADNIQIRIIQWSERDEVLNFLRKNFYPDEPLMMGSTQELTDAGGQEFDISKIAHGTCLMAVQEQTVNGVPSERIVGVLLSGPKYKDEVEHLLKEAACHVSTNWGNVVRILAQTERDSNVFECYNVEKALHMHVGVVDRLSRGCALGMRLKEKLKELGRQLGYPLLTTDCTSFYSQNTSERMGMDCVNVIKYADYLDEEGKMVFNPPLPHECLKTYAMRL